MPWIETAPVRQRQHFIADVQEQFSSMTELCARYGISRKIGYKALARYAERRRRSLADQSRAPHISPHRIDDIIAARVCDARREHPD